MKKQLLIASAVLLSLSASAQATLNLKPAVKPAINKSLDKSSRNMTCGNDTIFYSYSKEEDMGTSTYYIQNLIAGATNIQQWSQSVINSGTVNVHGISFFGKVTDATNPGQTVGATAVLYNVDATLKPTTMITSATVTMSTTFNVYTAMFSSPATVSGNFAVAINNSTNTDTLTIYLNDGLVSNYGGEGLPHIKNGTTWYPLTALDPTAGNELIIAPIVTYPIATDFTVSANPSCIGTVLNLTNTTPNAVLNNRMFNYNAYVDYFDLPSTAVDSTFAWDMDDATPAIWSTNASHSYTAAGTYDVTLYTFSGFYAFCLDTKTTSVVIDPNTVAGFTSDATNTPTIAFSNTSTGATSYSWDFGDGSPADNTANPSHTYGASGNYTVTLTATGPCGTNTSTTTVNIAATGIDTYEMNAFSVYPNPSNGLFTVNMNTAAKTVVEVYNVIGEVVYSTQLTNNTAVVDLSNNAAGVYTLKVISGNSTSVKQIVLTK